MSEAARNAIFAAVIAALALVVAFLVITAPSEADRVDSLGSRIKCPVCQGESIANSPSQMARDMMGLVATRVGEGASDQAIVDELLASYSGAVLLDPPVGGRTLLLWMAPLIALGVGVSVIVWWRRHPERSRDDATGETPSNRLLLLGGLILAGSFGLIVLTAGFFLQERTGPSSGVADIEVESLDEVSNETMEAVVAANLDNPQINGMRLALAERYYEIGDYRSAFPHYLAVAESELASDTEAVTALIRLGWMAWEGNGASEAAIGMFDQALAIDSSSTTARYLKGQVLWCGESDPKGAADLFSQILEKGDLETASRARIEADLAAASGGTACT